jgi:anti-sigma-K factor RskA
MPDDCEHWHRVIAERALRELDADTEFGVSTHLASCAESRDLAQEFGATAAALAHARPESRSFVADATDEAYTPSPQRLYAEIAARLAAIRSRRRRRTWAISVGAAAVLIGVFVMVFTTTRSTPEAAPDVVFATDAVNGDVALDARSWGTEIHLRGDGFTPGQQYNVWLERADGSRVGAGTFTGVTHRQVVVTLSSALAEGHAVAIGISQPDGTLVMRKSLT